jgi:2-phosphoglycerate kinase
MARVSAIVDSYHEVMQIPCQVLLLGGASGVGKTSVSYRLAHH